jgi:hypothetical protein
MREKVICACINMLKHYKRIKYLKISMEKTRAHLNKMDNNKIYCKK